MHYYKFNIGDYASHTQHLDITEDMAYRRMLDWLYLHESPLPDNVDQIARLIRMRSHSDCIAVVLREFFELGDYGWFQSKAMREIDQYKAKSNKAKESAAARWNKRDANALQAECDSNANHKPLTTNHKPLTTNHKPLTNIKDLSAAPSVEQDQAVNDFEIFYSAGMVKKGRKQALAKFTKLANQNGGSFAFANKLVEDIRKRLDSNQLGFAELHPTTYLNNERWKDDIAAFVSTPTNQGPGLLNFESQAPNNFINHAPQGLIENDT